MVHPVAIAPDAGTKYYQVPRSLTQPLCGAAAEELLFRGILERGLAVFLKRRWLIACIAALLFALYHGNITQGILAFILGLVFSELAARGGLRAALAAHLGINLIALIA